MLPGYFPWYPMAGNRQIFIDDLSGYGYNPYNRIDPATVNLTVTGIRQLVTNLQQIGPGRYAGRTDGISLFAGQILPANDAMIHSLLPLAFDKTRMSEYFLTRMRNSLDQALDTLASVYGLDTSVLIGKPVLHPSFGLSRNYQSNQFAVFQDYILISTDKVKAADIMKYYLTLQPTKTGSYLADLFVNILCDKPEQCLANMYKLLELQESSRQMAINLGKSAEQYDARLALREPLIEAVRQVGELKAVQAMIAYVLDSGKPADDQLFLKQLTEGTSYEIGD